MKVSVVIINYNSTEFTIKCVNSILEKTTSEIEIIIVDNNSRENERNKIEEWHKENSGKVKYIESRKNTGFAMGNMLGANFATGEYLFFLNNDCLLMNNAIDEFVNFMDSHPEAGLAGPQCFNGQGEHTPSFGYIPTVANKWLGNAICRLFNKGKYPPRKKEYSSPIKVQMISGSAMFFRRNNFNKLGGLDSNLFLYCEEEDVSIRAKKEGYEIFHVPSAKIMHFCGGSTERNIDIEKEFYISLFYLLGKHYTLVPRALIKSRYILKETTKTIRDRKRLPLLFFLLKGPSLTQSLRHKQEFR